VTGGFECYHIAGVAAFLAHAFGVVVSDALWCTVYLNLGAVLDPPRFEGDNS